MLYRSDFFTELIFDFKAPLDKTTVEKLRYVRPPRSVFHLLVTIANKRTVFFLG